MKEYEQRPEIKEMRKKYHEEWHQKNKEKELIRSGKWKMENPIRFRELKLKAQKKYYKKYPQKIKAQNTARYHIPLKKECGICKSPERLERHHWRYDKPLLVSTLCKDCHTVQHIKHFGGGNSFG